MTPLPGTKMAEKYKIEAKVIGRLVQKKKDIGMKLYTNSIGNYLSSFC